MATVYQRYCSGLLDTVSACEALLRRAFRDHAETDLSNQRHYPFFVRIHGHVETRRAGAVGIVSDLAPCELTQTSDIAKQGMGGQREMVVPVGGIYRRPCTA